jgi:glycosyltransferase involved in cell wall biosynthesis
MPSSRLRVYQYLSPLRSLGLEVDVMPALPEPLFSRLYYSRSRALRLVQYLAESLGTIWRALKSRAYDVVVIQKGLVLSNLRGLDRLFSGTRLVFDMDDAVYGMNVAEFRQPFLKMLQDAGQTLKLSKQAAAVVVGNQYLKDLALQHNPRVYTVPTPVDTDRILPMDSKLKSEKKDVVIGWLGIGEGVKYLSLVRDALREAARRHPVRLRVVTLLTGKKLELDGIETELVDWKLEEECLQMNRFDIGISPLFDAPWERGKCSLKLLQFMAAGLPTVSSRAGMNQEIIEDGKDGFLAGDTEEWVHKLGRLIQDADLRKKMGQAAREKVVREYSLNKMAGVLCKALQEVAA